MEGAVVCQPPPFFPPLRLQPSSAVAQTAYQTHVLAGHEGLIGQKGAKREQGTKNMADSQLGRRPL